MADQKNKTTFGQFGEGVTVSNTDMPLDHEASAVIQRIGRDKTPPGQIYKGSFTIHFYVDSLSLVKNKIDVCSVEHLTMKENISEQLMSLFYSLAGNVLRQKTNSKYKPKSSADGKINLGTK